MEDSQEPLPLKLLRFLQHFRESPAHFSSQENEHTQPLRFALSAHTASVLLKMRQRGLKGSGKQQTDRLSIVLTVRNGKGVTGYLGAALPCAFCLPSNATFFSIALPNPSGGGKELKGSLLHYLSVARDVLPH